MPGGQSATRPPLRSTGLVSTVGSHSDTPPPGTEKRSCNASPRPAARGSLCQSPWAFVLWEASDRPTRPTPPCGRQIRWLLHALLRSSALGPAHVARLVTGIAHVAVSTRRQGDDLQNVARQPRSSY